MSECVFVHRVKLVRMCVCVCVCECVRVLKVEYVEMCTLCV